MSFAGKIFWTICIFSFAIVFFARLYLGGWLNLLYIPLATCLISFVAACVIDVKYYAETLTLRTTKYGMNAGVSVLLFLVVTISFNVISVQMNRSVDLSSAQKNTLSPEIKKVINNIDSEVLVSIYHRGKKDKVALLDVKQSLVPFISLNKNVQTEYIDIYKETTKAKIELKGIPTEDNIIVLVRHKEKTIKVNLPIQDISISQAFIQATRQNSKKIYFLVGYGEKSTYDEKADGLMGLKQVLTSKGFLVENIYSQDLGKVSNDSALALIGPKFKIEEDAVDKITNYVNEGGALIAAIDPGFGEVNKQLLANFGFLHADNYIIAEVGEKFGRSPTTSIGLTFSSKSEITSVFKSSKKSFALFETTSEVKVTKNSNYTNFNYTPLIATTKKSFVVDELKIELNPGARASKTLAVLGEAKNPNKGKVFLVGDSDFLTNKDLLQGVNKQLAINIFASFTSENDLVTRPNNSLKKESIILTDRLRNSIVVAGFCMPFFMFLIAGLLFFRRKRS